MEEKDARRKGSSTLTGIVNSSWMQWETRPGHSRDWREVEDVEKDRGMQGAVSSVMSSLSTENDFKARKKKKKDKNVNSVRSPQTQKATLQIKLVATNVLYGKNAMQKINVVGGVGNCGRRFLFVDVLLAAPGIFSRVGSYLALGPL